MTKKSKAKSKKGDKGLGTSKNSSYTATANPAVRCDHNDDNDNDSSSTCNSNTDINIKKIEAELQRYTETDSGSGNISIPIDADQMRCLQAYARLPGGFCTMSLRARVWPLIAGCSSSANGSDTEHVKQEESVLPFPASVPHSDAAQVEMDVSRSLFTLLHAKAWPEERVLQEQGRLKDTILTVLRNNEGNSAKSESGKGGAGASGGAGGHSRYHYYQGYHDVATVVQYVLCPPSETTSASVNGNTCAPWQLLQSISQHYLRDFLASDFAITAAVIPLVLRIVKYTDPALYSHLQEQGLQPYFCTSWVLTWFSHELNDIDIMCRVMDVLLCSPPSYILYLSAAYVLLHRSVLLDMEGGSEIHHMLCKGPSSHTGHAGMDKDRNKSKSKDEHAGVRGSFPLEGDSGMIALADKLLLQVPISRLSVSSRKLNALLRQRQRHSDKGKGNGQDKGKKGGGEEFKNVFLFDPTCGFHPTLPTTTSADADKGKIQIQGRGAGQGWWGVDVMEFLGQVLWLLTPPLSWTGYQYEYWFQGMGQMQEYTRQEYVQNQDYGDEDDEEENDEGNDYDSITDDEEAPRIPRVHLASSLSLFNMNMSTFAYISLFTGVLVGMIVAQRGGCKWICTAGGMLPGGDSSRYGSLGKAELAGWTWPTLGKWTRI